LTSSWLQRLAAEAMPATTQRDMKDTTVRWSVHRSHRQSSDTWCTEFFRN